jgi:hypothetical protein
MLPFRPLEAEVEALLVVADLEAVEAVLEPLVVLESRGGDGRGAAKERAEVRVDCLSGEVERRMTLPLPLTDDVNVDVDAVEEEVDLGLPWEEDGCVVGFEDAEDAEDLGAEEAGLLVFGGAGCSLVVDRGGGGVEEDSTARASTSSMSDDSGTSQSSSMETESIGSSLKDGVVRDLDLPDVAAEEERLASAIIAEVLEE